MFFSNVPGQILTQHLDGVETKSAVSAVEIMRAKENEPKPGCSSNEGTNVQ